MKEAPVLHRRDASSKVLHWPKLFEGQVDFKKTSWGTGNGKGSGRGNGLYYGSGRGYGYGNGYGDGTGYSSGRGDGNGASR